MSRGAWALALTAAIGVFAGSFALLHVGWYAHGGLTDLPVYQNYAHLIRDGHVPYRDFRVEYPPAALPAFVLPTYLPWSYPTSFAVLMFVCGVGCFQSSSGLAGSASPIVTLEEVFGQLQNSSPPCRSSICRTPSSFPTSAAFASRASAAAGVSASIPP